MAANSRKLMEFTVSQLSMAIKRAVEDRFPYVQLRGEISGYRGPHGSGHAYFSLKDANARIDAVIWKGVFARMRVKPEEGMEVVATGKVTTFPGKSSYQIMIDKLEPAGIGALLAQLEARKKQLAAEGLFDEARKQPLPFLPRTVGIVTSPTGAVIRDMMHGFHERFPTHVLVWPVRVQGAGSGDEVAAGIRGFNALPADGDIPRPDVLIVARGGGSLEDLWGFNDESVVRAVAESRIPVISAVGHETDWTLIDHAADARAPTPTKAAEWAVPKLSEQLERVMALRERLLLSVRRELERQRQRLAMVAGALPTPDALLAAARQRLDHTGDRLAMAMRFGNQQSRSRLENLMSRMNPEILLQQIEQRRTELAQNLQRRHQQAMMQSLHWNRQRLDNASRLLKSVGHEDILRRGFVLVQSPDGQVMTSRKQMRAAGSGQLVFQDGTIDVQVKTDDVSLPLAGKDGGKGKPYGQKAHKARNSRPQKIKNSKPEQKTESDPQGSLF